MTVARKRRRATAITLASACLVAAPSLPPSVALQAPRHHRVHYRMPTHDAPSRHRITCRRDDFFQHGGDSSRLHTSRNADDEIGEEGSGGGSVAGATLLFAGTAVGAGMIALPAETVGAGFAPSAFGLLLCWAFTYATSLVTLEASWLAHFSSCAPPADAGDEEGGGGGGGGFLSISRIALGIPGEVVTASLFWFLLTAILVAYTAEGGQLVSQFAGEVARASVPPTIGSLVFATFFASLATYGTSVVDAINRIFVLGLVLTFIGLVGVSLPMVRASNLYGHSDWGTVYPSVISIGILSFGAQNVVPTILQYLDYDSMKTRRAVLFGSLLPLVLYTVWEAVFLGLIDASNTDGSKIDAVSTLGRVGGPIVTDLVEVFSLCAIGSSMAGASISLVDFFQDGMNAMSGEDECEVDEDQSSGNGGRTRLVAAVLALGPPVVLAYAFPDIFLVALEEAGLLGGVSLYGLIPALSILSLRRSSSIDSNLEAAMPGRLGGGDALLIAIVAISSALILPEVRNLIS